MSKQLDPFKTTASDLHRITFRLSTLDSWYAIMREARALYGRNWRAQPRVKRKLTRIWAPNGAETVWFEVPDPQFGTWCALKLAVVQEQPANK
jgi:hypothetical protein